MKTFKALAALLLFTVATISAPAQTKDVKQFVIDGATFYGTKAIPDELLGFYQYEKTKAPIVDVKREGQGKFQPHDVPAYPTEFWVQTDAKGNIEKTTGVNGNYMVILIVLYGDNGESGWKGDKKGRYDRMQAVVAYDQGYAIILGERFKPLK
ncbi:hypothetical protein HYN59_11950 [Flavobacterium album]|uniref:Uncharacterized protein n=1 Tax=Flavobacterium album TaxID=2175091 RepID=A0A2S1QZF2_9FLAO|nr:hypothetical protein [Flavobacterium album]AWH85778.1 hypothetical protein HYN59_11950 [Flavobacterium album]